ncbi:MAG: sulfite exporter TauE/SafE family protein [Chloroflexota bacterium]
MLGSSLVLVAVAGFLAQLVDGALGMGYGVTSTTILLTAGLAPAMASASVHMAELGTTLASGAAHWRFGNVNWKVVSRLALPGCTGAFLGAYVLSNIDASAAKPWVSLFLSLLAILILYRAVAGRAARLPRMPVRWYTLGPLGLFAGFLDAAGGGGWGPVTTSTLIAGDRMAPRKVIGTVSASEFLVAFGASVGFLLGLGTTGIAWDAVAVLLAGGVVAAPVAAWLVRHIDHRAMGVIVAGMILFTNSERVLALFGVGPEAALVVRLAFAIATVAGAATHDVRKRRAAARFVAEGRRAAAAADAEGAAAG